MPQKYVKKSKDLRETKKGWADGAREDFLEQYVDEYSEAIGKGTGAEDEVLRKVYRQYFFHFDLDDTLEPVLPLKPYDESWVPPPDDMEPAQLRLNRELKEKKKKAIRSWLLYRSEKLTSIRSTIRRRFLSDAYLALLNKVGKLGMRPPKARSPFQEWQKQNKEEATRIVQDLWDIEVSAGRETIPGRGGIPPRFRQETVQAHFNAFSDKDRKAWAETAKRISDEKKAAWNDIYNGPPSKDPEDRAACVRNLPAFLQPVSEGIMNLTGLMTIIHVVGPMGVLEGEIGVVSICSGKNLDPKPVTVAKWEPAVYEEWRNHLVKFAKTAYTDADKDTFKLPSTPQLPPDFKATLFDDDVLDKVVESMDAQVAAKIAGEGDEPDDDDEDDDDEDDVDGESARPRKRPAKSSHSSARKRAKQDGEGEGSKDVTDGNRKAAPVGSSQLVLVDGRWISQYEVERLENIRRNEAQLKALGLGLIPKAPVPQKKATPVGKKIAKPAGVERRRQSGRLGEKGTAPTPSSSGAGQPMEVDDEVIGNIPDVAKAPNVENSRYISSPSPPSPPTVPDVPIPSLPSPGYTVAAVDSGSQVPGSLLAKTTRLQAEAFTSDGSVSNASGGVAGEDEEIGSPTGIVLSQTTREILLESPDWFSVPYRVFCARDWGSSWEAMLKAYIDLEFSVEFDAEGNLPKAGRPAILSDWVADGRLKPKRNSSVKKKMLALKSKDFPGFKATFKAWWDSMQPAWRKEDEVGKRIQKRHGRDFGVLEAWGQNGWLSIVACLYWWRDVETDGDELVVWVEYVNDVAWMMEGLQARRYEEK